MKAPRIDPAPMLRLACLGLGLLPVATVLADTSSPATRAAPAARTAPTTTAPAASTASTAEWTLDGLRFTLHDQSGACALRMQGRSGPAKEQATALPWPCQFHLDKQGRVRTVANGPARTVLIESSTRQSERDCDTRLQGLRVSAGRMTLSPHHDRVASCPPFQWDAMVFSALF